jgi:hypothetical protein
VALLEDSKDYRKCIIDNLVLFQRKWKEDKVYLLEEIELQIDCFSDAEKFLDSIKTACPFDLVIIDMVLSGVKTGLDVIEYLNTCYPAVSKLAMSAQSLLNILKQYQLDKRNVQGIFRNFSCDYFEKCGSRLELQKSIESLVILRLGLIPYENDRLELIKLNGIEKNRNIIKHQISQYETAFLMFNELLLYELEEFFLDAGDYGMSEKIMKLSSLQMEYKYASQKLNEVLNGSVTFENVILGKIVEGAIGSFTGWFNKRGIKCDFVNENHMEKICGSELLIKQVVMNLIVNSIESLNLIKDKNHRIIQISDSKKDQKIVLIIKDYGLGISKDKLSSIFQNGVTTKKSNGNSGIGMCFVREILQNHGAEIKIESEEGKYFQTEIYFPIVE